MKHAAARLCGLYKRSNSAKIAVYSVRNGQMRRDRIQLRKRRCHRAFSPSREAGFYIESPRTAACAVRQSLPPMWRTRVPGGVCTARHLWECAIRPPEAAPPVHVRCFRCIVSFFVCVAFEKRLQIVSQKDGPCGTAFALGAMRPATSRPFCTSLQSRRACPQSAAPRAARAV